MEIRHLQHFLAVARAGSLSAAAAELGMAQSGISSSLAALEREVAVSLVSRSPGRRGIELTVAGRALLAPAQEVLEAVATARSAVAATVSSGGTLRGGVRIATITTPPQFSLLQTLLDFQCLHPEVEVSTVSGGNDEVVDRVAAGKVDLAIAAVGPGECPGLEVVLITSSPLVLVCSPGHRLADVSEVRPHDLVGERLLGRAATHRARRMLDAWLLGGGVGPQQLRIIESDDYAAVMDVVGRGQGLTYGPAAFADVLHKAGLVGLPLHEGPVWELSVVTAVGGPTSVAAAALRDNHLMRCAAVNSEPFSRSSTTVSS